MFALILLILVTSREVLWIRPIVGLDVYNLFLAAIFFVLLIIASIRFLHSYSGQASSLSFHSHQWRGYRKIRLVVISTIVFLILHELTIGDRLRGFKHAFYYSLIVVLPFVNLKAVARLWVRIATVASVAMVIQAVLVFFFYGNNLNSFERLPVEAIADRTEQQYTFPFFMGLLRSEDQVYYGDFSFFRMAGFSTEPKVYSTFLWGAIVCLAYRCRGKEFFRHPLLALYGVALLLNHAYTSFGILIVGIMFWVLKPGTRALGRLAGVMGTLVLFIYMVSRVHLNFASLDFFGNRISTFFSYAINGLVSNTGLNFTMWGAGWGEKSLEVIDTLRIPTMFANALHYGFVGVTFFLVIFFYCVKLCLEGRALTKDAATKMVFVLIPTLHLVYQGFFMPEPITPLHSFFLALALRLYSELAVEKEQKLGYTAWRQADLTA